MVGPGYRNKMLTVKSRKNTKKIVNLNEIIFFIWNTEVGGNEHREKRDINKYATASECNKILLC